MTGFSNPRRSLEAGALALLVVLALHTPPLQPMQRIDFGLFDAWTRSSPATPSSEILVVDAEDRATLESVVALAKQREEVFTAASLQPVMLDVTSPALHTLQKIRDEAHRFAITYHRKLRTRRTIQSVIDGIPGVGPAIRTSLLRTFGSARRIREATVADLAAVPKVTPKLAERIYDHFHPREPAVPASQHLGDVTTGG